jgi:hypothetical protein
MKSYLHQESDDAFFKLIQVFKTHLLLSPAVSLDAPEGCSQVNTSWYKVHGHQVLEGLWGVLAFFSKQAKNTSKPLPNKNLDHSFCGCFCIDFEHVLN